jgi:hypothetical protein
MASIEAVGVAEIAELLGVAANTVASWRQRKQLPPPRWDLKSGPIWLAEDITIWYAATKGTRDFVPPPNRVAEAIDMSNEPGRAEVYAHYGLAMGMAQIVEQHLATVIAFLKVPEPYDRTIFVEIIENANRKTMGQLKDALKASGAPVIGITHLERAVQTRNLLAHLYFVDADRSVKLTTESGRFQLIEELDAAARELFLTSQHLRTAELRLAINRGASKAGVMQRLRELRGGAIPETRVGQRAAKLVVGSPDVDRVVEEAFADAEPRLRPASANKRHR